MKFSFIIINYKTPDLTCQCLDSIFKYCHGDFEIILLDNNSGDNSITRLEDRFNGRIKLIKNESNLGFARANNLGANVARGDLLFFLNSDTLMVEDVLKNIEDSFNSNQNLAIVSPELFLNSETPQDDAYGNFLNLSDLILKHFRLKKIKRDKDRVDWVSGASLIIRRDVFEKIGGWDENYFMYMEDADMCWAVKKLGYDIAVCKNSKIIHFGGKSLTKNFERRKYYFQSQNYFFQKHYGYLSMIILKIIRLPYLIYLYLNK